MKLKKITLASIVIFFLLMLPVLYLSFVNRASGDDYGYGAYTRSAWMSTHSLIALGSAIWQTVRQCYFSWQGTWFSVLLFSLQPEVFSDRAYFMVAFLVLFFWIGSTLYLFNQILCQNMKLNRWAYLVLTIWFLIISIEFIPSTKSAIYWFNGCAHYMIPFAMCQMVAAWLLSYSKQYKKGVFIGATVFMTLLGGSNYQAALFVLIAAFYIVIADWLLKKDKRIFRVLFPVGFELAGLVVSMKAPGNKVRGGDEFGFSVERGIETIFSSFLKGFEDIRMYLQERPLVFVGLLLLTGLMFLIFSNEKELLFEVPPLLLIIMLFCLYSAMQAPAIYAGVEVSGGVHNMNFQVFLLAAAGSLMIITACLARRIKVRWKRITTVRVQKIILAFVILLCLFLTLIFRSNIKRSTSFICLRYIASGEAEDYREQMNLQTGLMECKEINDIVVPFINDVQGPLMQMPVTENPAAWSNQVTARFYGKNSVVAIERSQWEELYTR